MSEAPEPDGTKMNMASGFASAARCRNGPNSGFISGTRSDSTTLPPAFSKAALKAFSVSRPGA